MTSAHVSAQDFPAGFKLLRRRPQATYNAAERVAADGLRGLQSAQTRIRADQA